jgi:hypothetical protein
MQQKRPEEGMPTGSGGLTEKERSMLLHVLGLDNYIKMTVRDVVLGVMDWIILV